MEYLGFFVVFVMVLFLLTLVTGFVTFVTRDQQNYLANYRVWRVFATVEATCLVVLLFIKQHNHKLLWGVIGDGVFGLTLFFVLVALILGEYSFHQKKQRVS